MRVGMLTSWRTQCGIAEYSRTLAGAFAARHDVEFVVLGSRNYDERETQDFDSPFRVERVFDVELWNRYGHRDLDVDRILEMAFDVIHVQYENVLFNLDRLHELMHRFAGPVFVTWHDNCNPPALRSYDFEHAFTHRRGVGPGQPEVIQFPIRRLPAVVRTFGLGRSQEDVIGPICERNGWVFESFATSEAAMGGQAWKPWSDLHEWLRGADVIVQWYPDHDMAGSSQAARTALATRRPVVVNDVTWFADLVSRDNLWKVPDDPAQLEQTLQNLLADPYLFGEASAHAVVEHHVLRYQEALGS